MDSWLRFVGPNQAVELLGVKLTGVNAENGRKLIFTIVFIGVMMLVSAGLRGLVHLVLGEPKNVKTAFWSRQAIRLATAVLLILGLTSIWFDNPTRLATAFGLVTAGLAFALQRVVTAVAGYFVLLWGETFNVGDRIVMGGVRGDVVALSFIQTTIMEMGEPPSEQADAPAMWVAARQYTGRIVTVTNDKIFDTPVYNYTRDFPFLWEEMRLPVPFTADRQRAEQILLDAARRHTRKITSFGEADLVELERRYFMKRADLEPRVFWRVTDNWVEMSVRFLVEDHGIREIKDAMSREILQGLDEAKISVASSTFEITGLPVVQYAPAEK